MAYFRHGSTDCDAWSRGWLIGLRPLRRSHPELRVPSFGLLTQMRCYFGDALPG